MTWTTAAGNSWDSLTGDLTETQVIPFDGGTVGTPDTGISRIAAAGLAIGNGTTGDYSGSLKLTGINLQGLTTSELVATDSSKNLISTTALPNGTTATTQAAGDSSTDVATDAFVTTAVANAIAGVNPAVAVLAATTASITGTYTQVGGGVGDTFQITATGTPAIDGVAFGTLAQRVLLKNQTSANQNGIYFLSVLGTVSTGAIFTRALDYDTVANVNNTGAIPVQSGTVNTATSWLLTSQVTSIGSSGSALTYTQFSYNPAQVALLASPTFTGTVTLPNIAASGTTSFTAGSIAIAALAADTIGLTDSTGLFTVTGSPAALGGSLTLSAYASQSKNTFLGGPSAGAGAASFRVLTLADLPSVTSATFSGFWGGLGQGNILGVGTPTSSTGWTPNQALVWMFYISESIAVSKVTINVITVAASSAVSVGIFNTAGTKLIDSGVFTTTAGGTGTGAATNTFASTTLTPGWYYFCFTSNSGSNAVEYFGSLSVTAVGAILNKNGARIGTATATTGGAQNTTLGTVTATYVAANADIACSWFE
jgi:hypothetical protein